MIRVLVAEDFGLLREDLCETLGQQEDMEVAGSAASGREIESLALSTRFDVVLMDIEMETTTAGIRAAERILEKKPEVKVIFLTAHETENMILTSMGAGAVDYIVKGCDEEELLRRIREAAAGHTVLDERVQNLLMKEYTRLRRSERSLLFFITAISQLTTAERELVRLLLEGKKIREIAAAHPGQTVALFSHGTAIRCLQGALRGLGPGKMDGLGHSDNTAVTKLVWDGAQFLVEYTSDASHVPDGLSTLKKQLWWRKDSKAEDVNLRYVPAGPGLWQAFSKDTLAGQLELELDREAEEQNGWITRLALEPSFTGQNLGVQLIGQAVSVYRPLGRSYLRLCIAKEQKEILGFFRAYGFYKIDECAQGDIWEKYIGYHR